MNIGRKLHFLALAVIVLTAVFWPSVALAQPAQPAQPGKDGLIIRFSPNSYPYNVRVGEDNVFYLEIENGGNQDITNIRLYGNAPAGWVIEIVPETISLLAAGSVRTIDANLKTATKASKGDYQISFIAEGDGIRRVMTTWVRVERSSSVWLWVGIGIGIAVVAGFILVFLRTRRQ